MRDKAEIALGVDNIGLLGKAFLLSAAIIALNFLLRLYAPTTSGIDDDFYFYDLIWRAVQGQRIGVDYHDTLGFGPFQLAALFGRWDGLRFYVLPLAASLIALAVAFCACVVARRRLSGARNFGLLFCATLACEASAPGIYGSNISALGPAMFFDRLSDAALAVLFLQVFGGTSDWCERYDATEITVSAFLLNILFLTKISGVVLGVAILFSACPLRRRFVRGISSVAAALSLFGAVAAIECWGAGLRVGPLMCEYAVAGRARAELLSPFAIVRSIWHLVVPVALLALFAVSRRRSEMRPIFWNVAVLVGSYAVIEGVTDLENSRAGTSTLFIAPAAAAVLVSWADANNSRRGAAREYGLGRLAEISARDSIPYLLIAIALFPQIASTSAAAALDLSVAFGRPVPLSITAGKALAHSYTEIGEPWDPAAYLPAVKRALGVLSALRADNASIVTLDFANPFPALLESPSPKGVYASYDDHTLPGDLQLTSDEVLGDACFVNVPAPRSEVTLDPSMVRRLTAAAMPKLTAEFDLVYRDEWWSIYRRKQGCAGSSAQDARPPK